MARVYQALFLLFAATPSFAAVHGKHVDFDLLDNSKPSSSENWILSKTTITPYVQWNENNGYCGEVSSVQAAMGLGQWMSQYNARLICGTGLSQSGPDGFCEAHGSNPDYNAQFLFENPNPGDQPFASAATCLANAHLAYEIFDAAGELAGMEGYRQYLSWVKSRLIAGDTVAVGVLNRGGDDPQYDHEVTVSKIGTNHSPTDSTYYDDDVLYFEDHGPSGLSFSQGYTFSELANTRAGANMDSANSYSILIPGGALVQSGTGGDGVHPNPIAITPKNYGFAVSGIIDPKHETLPVALTIVGSSVNGVPNSSDPVVGFNFESPEIGGGSPSACTNVPPTWMEISLEATVSGLTPGVKYNLYEYDLNGVGGLGAEAALKIPDQDFNAHADQAAILIPFTAESSTFTQIIETTSDKVVVFRCVRADAP